MLGSLNKSSMGENGATSINILPQINFQFFSKTSAPSDPRVPLRSSQLAPD